MIDIDKASSMFKALCEPVRIQIVAMLSGGEKCACELLESLSVSQSTLSHHMKLLMESSLVKGRKEGTWVYYSIDAEAVTHLHHAIDKITQPGSRSNYSRPGAMCKRQKKN